jgi:hypothetical protein
MKCPKCSYHSFDHLDNCKKCGQDLTEHKAKFNLRGFHSPGEVVVAEPEPVVAESSEELDPPADGAVDFGFDFLEEEEGLAGEPADSIALGDDNQSVNIDQPFGADSETIPADTPASDTESDSDDKPGKGPEFAF